MLNYLDLLAILVGVQNGTYGLCFYYIISIESVMADGWCGNKKSFGKTGGIW